MRESIIEGKLIFNPTWTAGYLIKDCLEDGKERGNHSLSPLLFKFNGMKVKITIEEVEDELD